MRWVVLAALASACGRLGFDARQVAGDGSPGADSPGGDAPGADGSPDGSGIDAAVGTGSLVQQSPVAPSAGGSVTATFPAATTSGNLLIAAIATNDPTSLVLPAGWMMGGQSYTAGSCAATVMYYPANPGGITQVPVTINGGVPLDVVLAEFDDKNTMPKQGNFTASSSSPTMSQMVSSLVPLPVPTLDVAVFCEDVNQPTYTNGAGWTSLGTFTNVSSSPSFTADHQLAPANATVAETVTSSLNGKFQAELVLFAPQ